MRTHSLSAAMAMGVFFEAASADLCHLGSKLVKGNWYCQAVQRISYKGIGSGGTYNKITNMDKNTGRCSSVPAHFSGSMSPLDEDISLHFRGPLKLKQFAVYMPTRSSSPEHSKKKLHGRRHDHARFHQEQKEKRELEERAELEKKAVGDLVIATINGQVVSWINQYDGSNEAKAKPTPGPAANPAAAVPAPAPAAVSATPGSPGPAKTSKVVKPKDNSKAKGSPAGIARGDWGQVAYYNSEDRSAHGVTFLNNLGGQGSGVFDMTFGNSLSYASRDGSAGAASPEVFDGSLQSNQEISVFSEQNCRDTDCGYVRPGSVAYKGFEGGQKAFFMEFMMPDDGKTGWNQNQPAIWALNGQIPRTLQYGKAECSCWKSGCGEFDIFETLHSGSRMTKSTLHGAVSGGSSDYFHRPTTTYIKAAVIMRDDGIVVQQLPDNFDINNTSIPAQQMLQMFDDSKTSVANSVFRLGQH